MDRVLDESLGWTDSKMHRDYTSGPNTIREIKVCLLGDAGVGKSCLVHRFVSDSFNSSSPPTIGAAFMTKMMLMEDQTFKFNIWDTAGQERFKSLAPLYYRDAAAAILVYDITNDTTFDALKTWIKELQRYGPPDIQIAIAGNKCDKENQREVSEQDAQEFAASVDAVFAETSALTSKNVYSLFEDICRRLPQEGSDAYGPGTRPLDSTVPMRNEPRKKQCCSSK